jgi:hypothetical protein
MINSFLAYPIFSKIIFAIIPRVKSLSLPVKFQTLLKVLIHTVAPRLLACTHFPWSHSSELFPRDDSYSLRFHILHFDFLRVIWEEVLDGNIIPYLKLQVIGKVEALRRLLDHQKSNSGVTGMMCKIIGSVCVSLKFYLVDLLFIVISVCVARATCLFPNVMKALLIESKLYAHPEAVEIFVDTTTIALIAATFSVKQSWKEIFPQAYGLFAGSQFNYVTDVSDVIVSRVEICHLNDIHDRRVFAKVSHLYGNVLDLKDSADPLAF